VVAVAATQPAGVFLAGNGVDEVGVDAQHDLVAEVAGGDQGWGDAAMAGGDEVPYPGAYGGAGGIDAVQAGGADLGQGPGEGGRGGDLAEQVLLVTQHVDGAHGVTAVGHHDRRVAQHPAPVVARGEVFPVQRVRQGGGQAGAVGDQTQRGGASVGHDAIAVGGDGQPL
jgi:hypothetical protein